MEHQNHLVAPGDLDNGYYYRDFDYPGASPSEVFAAMLTCPPGSITNITMRLPPYLLDDRRNLRGFLAGIGRMTRLEHLNIMTNGIVCFSHLPVRTILWGVRRVETLRSIAIHSAEVETGGLGDVLLNFPVLDELYLWGGGADRDMMASVARSSSIRTLKLCVTLATDEGLRELVSMPNLHRLELVFGIAYGVTPDGIAYLCHKCPSLEIVEFAEVEVEGEVWDGFDYPSHINGVEVEWPM